MKEEEISQEESSETIDAENVDTAQVDASNVESTPTEKPVEFPDLPTMPTAEKPLVQRITEWSEAQPPGASFTMEEATAIFGISVEEFTANFMALKSANPKLNEILVYPK
jgi:hypothetical protein